MEGSPRRKLVTTADSYISHFECSETGREYPANSFQTLSEVGAPLLARYELDRLRADFPSNSFLDVNHNGMWTYRRLLPLFSPESIVSLGEIETPLVPVRLARDKAVFVKDEGFLPSGSFKARGLSVLTSVAKQFGISRLVIPTAGNAGAALAAYCARAGIESEIYCPADANPETVSQIRLFSERLFLVDGLINDCGEQIAKISPNSSWRNVSTFKEPYRVEGKKTIGFEISKQLGWRAPDYIFYPTGGGVGLVGIWKAFAELKALGILNGPLPKLVAVQPEGCSPIVDALELGEDKAPAYNEASTSIHGMRVPKPFADSLMLRTIRESDGLGIRVVDEDAVVCRTRVARNNGYLLCLEGAAVAAAFEKALRENLIPEDAEVVLINSASGLKDRLQPVPPATLESRQQTAILA